MSNNQKYYVLNEWGSDPETGKSFCNCIIGPATEEDELNDGQDSYSVSGGFTFDLFTSIREAIENAEYRPSAIQFKGCSIKELAEATCIVNELTNNKSFMAKFDTEKNNNKTKEKKIVKRCFIKLIDVDVDGCGTNIENIIQVEGKTELTNGTIQRTKDAIDKYKEDNPGEWDTDSIINIACEHLEAEGYICNPVLADTVIEF